MKRITKAEYYYDFADSQDITINFGDFSNFEYVEVLVKWSNINDVDSVIKLQGRAVGNTVWVDVSTLTKTIDSAAGKEEFRYYENTGEVGLNITKNSVTEGELYIFFYAEIKTTGIDYPAVPSQGGDEKVKYDAADPTAGYVSDKIIAGDGISVAEGTGGDVNKLVITNDDKGSDVDLSGKEDVSNKETSALDNSTDKYPCNNVVFLETDINGMTEETSLATDDAFVIQNNADVKKKVFPATIKTYMAIEPPVVQISPYNAEGLILALESDKGLTLDGDGKVSQWDDQSGMGNHATQTTAARRPTVTATGLNGYDTITFDSASTQWMLLPDTALADANMTVFVVCKCTNSTTNTNSFILARNYTGLGYRLSRYISAGNVNSSTFAMLNGANIGAITLNTTSFYMMTHEFNQHHQRLWIETTKDGTEAVYNSWQRLSQYYNVADKTSIGVGTNGTNYQAYFKGEIACIYVYDNSFTYDKKLQIWTWIKNKYGI
jgi:hypothetical protein